MSANPARSAIAVTHSETDANSRATDWSKPLARTAAATRRSGAVSLIASTSAATSSADLGVGGGGGDGADVGLAAEA